MNKEPARMAQLTRDQRQEDAERVVERREEPVEHHFQDLHDGSDHADIADQPEEAEIDIRQTGPCQGAVLQQVLVRSGC